MSADKRTPWGLPLGIGAKGADDLGIGAKGADVPIAGANAVQVAGQHYKTKVIQPWDYIASNGLGYFEGNVVKYVSRWRDKGGVEDLRKAAHYLDKLIELEIKA